MHAFCITHVKLSERGLFVNHFNLMKNRDKTSYKQVVTICQVGEFWTFAFSVTRFHLQMTMGAEVGCPKNSDPTWFKWFAISSAMITKILTSLVNKMHSGTLTEDYLDVVERGMQKIVVKQRREAPVVFKHNSTYYMLSSGCSSWDPNGALIHASTSMLGPWWIIGDPCVGGDEELRSLTFYSQGSFVLPLPGLQDTFIYMGDRYVNILHSSLC